jgi:hypothetical protein
MLLRLLLVNEGMSKKEHSLSKDGINTIIKEKSLSKEKKANLISINFTPNQKMNSNYLIQTNNNLCNKKEISSCKSKNTGTQNTNSNTHNYNSSISNIYIFNYR